MLLYFVIYDGPKRFWLHFSQTYLKLRYFFLIFYGPRCNFIAQSHPFPGFSIQFLRKLAMKNNLINSCKDFDSNFRPFDILKTFLSFEIFPKKVKNLN